jgi:hypothetical protein
LVGLEKLDPSKLFQFKTPFQRQGKFEVNLSDPLCGVLLAVLATS